MQPSLMDQPPASPRIPAVFAPMFPACGRAMQRYADRDAVQLFHGNLCRVRRLQFPGLHGRNDERFRRPGRRQRYVAYTMS